MSLLQRLIRACMFRWSRTISTLVALLACRLTATFMACSHFLGSRPPYPRQYRMPVFCMSSRWSDVHPGVLETSPRTSPICCGVTKGGLPLLGRSFSPSNPSSLKRFRHLVPQGWVLLACSAAAVVATPPWMFPISRSLSRSSAFLAFLMRCKIAVFIGVCATSGSTNPSVHARAGRRRRRPSDPHMAGASGLPDVSALQREVHQNPL